MEGVLKMWRDTLKDGGALWLFLLTLPTLLFLSGIYYSRMDPTEKCTESIIVNKGLTVLESCPDVKPMLHVSYDGESKPTIKCCAP